MEYYLYLKNFKATSKRWGNHKTVKQAPLKTKRRGEQGFDVHQCWINENETSRNIHSGTGNFVAMYQDFIS